MIAINSHPEPTLPNAPRLRGAMGRGEPGGGIACSRLSDSGEGAKEWGRRESAFSIPRTRLSRSLEQAIQIRSSLAAYQEITGGFEPNRNEEILFNNYSPKAKLILFNNIN